MGTASGAAVGLAFAVAAGVPVAEGAEWSVAPTFSVAVDNDSNRTLATNAIPSKGFSMSLDMRLQRATERLTLSLRPQAHIQRFNDRRFDRFDDGGFDAAAVWAATERSSFSLSGLLRDQNTLTAEIASTGIVNLNTRRRDEQASASWSLLQSELRTLTLSASFSSARYHGNEATSLQDNRYSTLGASERLQHSERLSFVVSGSLGESRFAGAGDTTRWKTASVGFDYRISERNRFAADLGVNRRTEGFATTQGFVGDLTLSRATDLGSYALSAQRSVSPSGYGLFSQSDQVRISMSRVLGPRLGLDSSLGVYRTSSVFQSISLAERTYSQLAIGLSWQATEEWTWATHALGSRAHSNGLFGLPAGSADGWQIRLDSTWAPARRSISR